MSGVAPVERGLAGRPPRNARAFLERERPVLAARWVRSCRRALRYLNDPKTPIDANWIKLFNSLADRLGHPRVTSQTVDSRSASFSASVAVEALPPAPPGAVSDDEAIDFLERRVLALRAGRAAAESEGTGE